jgi:signal peptidase
VKEVNNVRLLAGIAKVLSWPVYIAIAAMLAIAAPVVIGYHPVAVLSGSMEPAYPVGSIIYYKSAEFKDIGVGDAVTFRIGDSNLATHRVVAKNTENRSFITKGDNNPTEDGNPLPYSRIAGKSADFAIPYAGYLTSKAQNWRVIAVAVLILLSAWFIKPANRKAAAEM